MLLLIVLSQWKRTNMLLASGKENAIETLGFQINLRKSVSQDKLTALTMSVSWNQCLNWDLVCEIILYESIRNVTKCRMSRIPKPWKLGSEWIQKQRIQLACEKNRIVCPRSCLRNLKTRTNSKPILWNQFSGVHSYLLVHLLIFKTVLCVRKDLYRIWNSAKFFQRINRSRKRKML